MKSKLSIVKKLIRNNGFFMTIWLLIKMIFYKIKDRSFSQKNNNIIRDAVKNKQVIVFTKAIEWNNMFQRIQQMASEFSRQENTVVIYVESCSTHDFFANIKKISDSLYCYSFRHYGLLNDLLFDADEVIMYMTNLFEFDKNIELTHDKMVYEHVDELSLFFDDMELANKRFIKALSMCDLAVATATKLFLQVDEIAKKAILSPNAVDYQTFHGARKLPVAKDLADITKGYKLVLGYYGAIASWFDFKLIVEAATKKPDWVFVLIGTYFDDSHDEYNLNEHKNIVSLGAKPYNTLPSYISGIDILMIPFLINEITESTSPVKLFEYMASGTPILTAMLPECGKYKSVYQYKNADDFIETAEILYDKRNDADYIALLEKEALENTWSARVKEVLQALDN